MQETDELHMRLSEAYAAVQILAAVLHVVSKEIDEPSLAQMAVAALNDPTVENVIDRAAIQTEPGPTQP